MFRRKKRVDSPLTTDMLAGIMPGARSDPPQRGAYEFVKAYSEMPWLRAVTNRVAMSVSSVDWKIYAVRSGGSSGKAVYDPRIANGSAIQRKQLIGMARKAGELIELDNHPMTIMLNAANEYLTGVETRFLTQIHIDLVGDAYWIIERGPRGLPVFTWSIPPHWVQSTPTPEDDSYWISFRGWQGKIPASEVIRFRDPNPVNPYGRGVGVASALEDELETDEYAAKHIKSFFFNRARPDLLIYGTGLKHDDTKRLELDWNSKNRGFWQAFKPYFLNKDVKVEVLSQDFESMRVVELRQLNRDIVLQVFGISPEIFGILTNSNRSTIDASDYTYNKNVILPRAERMRSVLQHRVVPLFNEPRLIVDYISPVQEDKAHKLEVMKAAPYAFSVNDWREMAGAEPRDDGDVVLIPVNVTPQSTYIDLAPTVSGDNTDLAVPTAAGYRQLSTGDEEWSESDLPALSS